VCTVSKENIKETDEGSSEESKKKLNRACHIKRSPIEGKNRRRPSSRELNGVMANRSGVKVGKETIPPAIQGDGFQLTGHNLETVLQASGICTGEGDGKNNDR